MADAWEELVVAKMKQRRRPASDNGAVFWWARRRAINAGATASGRHRQLWPKRLVTPKRSLLRRHIMLLKRIKSAIRSAFAARGLTRFAA